MKILDEYRGYAETHGRISDAVKIYQRMIEITRCPVSKSAIRKEMFELNEDSAIRNENYFKEENKVISNSISLMD